ncbi:MAG: DUF493 family protein [Capnocytophaga sp.]|nr:DUF493 family protein [Capnocytophaga sp.]
MKSEKEIEEFYTRLKDELTQTSSWPSEYLYKFIIPNSLEKQEQLTAVFSDKKSETTFRESSNGKYLSVSVKLVMQNPDEVIQYYKEAGKVEGILSL